MEVGLQAPKAFERAMALLDWPFWLDQDGGRGGGGGGRPFQEHIAPSQCRPGGRLRQREEENLRVAVRADVHKMAPEYLLTPVQPQGYISRLRSGVDGGYGRTPSKHREVWHCSLGSCDSLLQEA